MSVNLTINKRKRTLEPKAQETLLDTLRGLGFASVKNACETTNCGLCTVLVDGLPKLSCALWTMRLEGACIETLEGIGEELDPLRELMAREGGEQCGFCSPGFLMNALALKRRGESFTEEELKSLMSGNLCRCTGYAAQMRALKAYLEV